LNKEVKPCIFIVRLQIPCHLYRRKDSIHCDLLSISRKKGLVWKIKLKLENQVHEWDVEYIDSEAVAYYLKNMFNHP